MKRLLFVFALCFVFAASAFAQTAVSINYIDKFDTTLVSHSPMIFGGNSSTWSGALTVKAPSAGTIGQIYVSGGASADPGFLSGQGSSGDILVSAGAGVNPVFTTIKQISTLGADSSMSSTTATKSGLSFVAAANSTYAVDIYVYDSVSASTGIKFDLYAVNAIGSITGFAQGSKKSDTCGFDIITADSTLGAAFTTYVPTTNYGVWMAHLTFVNGAAAQTVYLRYAKPTSGTAILKKGSYCEAWLKQ